ncbi:FMN2-like protein, partial [Mya arenaria]
MDSIQHLEYLYHKAMCQKRRNAPPSPPPSTDSGADHNGVLDRARQEYESRLQQAMERIVVLQRDVDKYRQLAGIEKLTQNALSEADRAQQEAGLHLDGVQTNGFPSTGSRYHPGEVNAALKPQGEMLMDLDATSESETSSLGGSSVGGSSVGEGGVPLPPPPPPPPLPGMIPPPPPPPSNMMPVQKAKKPVVHPKNPMKPLFWNRLQVDELKSTKNKQFLERPLLWEEIQELNIDITELDTLFSKTNIEPSRRLFSNKPKSKAKQRGDSEELKKLREYVKKHPDTPLDKPDQFVYDLSLIPDYAERIFCFIFREAFHDSISVIETKMTNLRMTCQDNSTSLLHFTVQQFIRKFEKGDAGTDKVRFPLPDPSDLQQGASVCFTELEKELVRIKKDFEAAEDRMDTVVRSAQEQTYLLQPFKDIMTDFFHKGKKELAEQEENLADGKRLFEETVLFFCVKPEGGKKEVTPENFFEKWYTFCQDFKDTWKKEQQRLVKIRIRENEVRVKQLQQRLTKQPVRTRTRTRGGL